jgi:hypothetical protein
VLNIVHKEKKIQKIPLKNKIEKRVYLEGGGKGGRGLFQFAERLAAFPHSGQLIHRQQLIKENLK